MVINMESQDNQPQPFPLDSCYGIDGYGQAGVNLWTWSMIFHYELDNTI